MANSKRLADANLSLNAEVRQRQYTQKTTLFETYKNQKKLPITISPMYKPHFGEVMEIQINGIYLSIPCDGMEHQVPETFASEAYSRIQAVDKSMRRAERMADVTVNKELAPGELELF